MEAGHYRKFDILWELPALSNSPLREGPDNSSANRLGLAKFSTWCRRFVTSNIAHRSAILRDIQLPLEAYLALLKLQTPEKWTDSPAIQDSMDDACQGFAKGDMVHAVLEELGIATPTKPTRHGSVIGIGSSSSASIGNWQTPTISGTPGTDMPRPNTSREDVPSIAKVDSLDIQVTGNNDCTNATNSTHSMDDTGKMGSTDKATMDAPKRRPRPKRPASPGIDEMTATEAELRELSRYFPAVAKDAVFCVGCAAYGHRIQFCPLRTCRLCDGSIGDHGLFGCPTLSPMDVVFRKIAPLKMVAIKKGKNSNRKGKGKKEKERAKAMELEEAAWAPEPERPAKKCKLCLEVTAHQDVCPMLWITFVPSPILKRKSDQISASCYLCGSEGHFGGDCSKNDGKHVSGRQFSLPDDIWCQKYAEKCMGSGTADANAPSIEGSVTGKQAHAKRAKTSADPNTPSTAKPQPTTSAPIQKRAGGQPAAPTLSKAQVKKANRKQRLADEARGILAKQSTQASKASQAHLALQTALPTRTAPLPSPPKGPKGQNQGPTPSGVLVAVGSNGNTASKQAPKKTSVVPLEDIAIKGLAGTGRSAPVPASQVYNLRQQKPHLQPVKMLEKKPAQVKQPQPPQKKAKAKQNQTKQAKQGQGQPQQPQPDQPGQPNQPNQPVKLSRKQRKRAASFTNAKANAQAEQAMQNIPGQRPVPKAKPGRRRRGTAAADEMNI